MAVAAEDGLTHAQNESRNGVNPRTAAKRTRPPMSVDLSMPILVVDDFTTMSRIMRGLLNQVGFQNVDAVNGGASALEKLRTGKYRLVISDWNMEPMSGYDLLQEIRSDAALAETRFIIVSADPSLEHVLAARHAGANGFVVKPFTAAALKARIDWVFANEGPDRAGSETVVF
jgi:two-component system, chemotaxis family, chemotaxis protein CheY